MLETDVPVLMHVVTRKGAGYGPAVRNPEKFHGIAPFDIATGEVKKKPCKAPSYTDVFGAPSWRRPAATTASWPSRPP